MTNVILASTSVYRKALLERLGLAVVCEPPGVDEDSYKSSIEDPFALAATLASAKARAVAQRHPGRIVIGGDQLVAGKTHELVTAMSVIAPDGAEHRHTDIAWMTMRPLDRERIERYVRLDCPIDCAGAYKIESAGIALFETIETGDHTAITGLPLMALTTILERLGLALPG